MSTDEPARCPGPQPALAKAEKVDAATATDLEWHLHSAHPHLFCGGCGDEAGRCHPGRCCTDKSDSLSFSRGVCDLCPTRHHTGQVVVP